MAHIRTNAAKVIGWTSVVVLAGFLAALAIGHVVYIAVVATGHR